MVKHMISKMITECNFEESNTLKWNQIINEINAFIWYDILANKRIFRQNLLIREYRDIVSCFKLDRYKVLSIRPQRNLLKIH